MRLDAARTVPAVECTHRCLDGDVAVSDDAVSVAAMIDLIVFVVASLMVVVGAIGVIAYRHPVHASLSLVLTLFGVAVHFVAMEAHFLAAVQVIVYAGAIVVLFLFVIMLLGVDKVAGPAHRTAPDPAPAGRRDGSRRGRSARRRHRRRA